MPILIDCVRVAGLRGLENIEMSLSPVTVLIGTNNSGKTSILKALQLALGEYARYLTAEDFFIDDNDRRAAVIIVDVRIIAVDGAGVRLPQFEPDWVQEFEDRIRAEPNGAQFHGIRTVVRPDSLRGGFTVDRRVMDRWPEFHSWTTEANVARGALVRRYDVIPFIAIDAQRDIHQELSEKTSFVGRVLSSVEYAPADVARLEDMITEVNRTAVERSASLTSLKSHLDALRDSFGGAGSAEVTPFPKKIRDLSKRFSVHFGASANTSFSMEYHGMGTRSWASMLAVKAFSDLQAQKHLDEARAFHPILAAEEPEAHLHPNAQRALYKQLSQSAGQVLISTHSPYLAAMCDLDSLRGVSASGGRRQGRQLVQGLGPEEKGVLHREVMRTRGEFLFAKAAIIFEGVTEEQIFPSIFEKYFGQPAFAMGVAFVGVGGKNYAPFIKLGASFGVPVFVVSDNDAGAQASVTAHINRIQQDTGLVLDPTNFGLSFLTAGNDVEAELIHIQGLRPEVIEALVDTETRGTDNLAWRAAKLTELNALGDNDLVDRMRSAKTSYSANLANAVTRNSRNLTGVQLAPPALRQAFQAVHQWLT